MPKCAVTVLGPNKSRTVLRQSHRRAALPLIGWHSTNTVTVGTDFRDRARMHQCYRFLRVVSLALAFT
jgi:hypothetical protein